MRASNQNIYAARAIYMRYMLTDTALNAIKRWR